MKRRFLALLLCLAALTGCAPRAPVPTPTATPTPTPTSTPTPQALTWLHGFYANSSYSQIAFTAEMDAVSLGWARLRLDESGPYLDTTRQNGNTWAVPEGAEKATGFFAEHGVHYNLSVFTSTANKTTLADGTETNVLAAAISPQYREAAARVLCDGAKDYGGLTVDFEGLRSADSREDFTALISLIREKLPADKPLYIAVPPDDWYHGYDYRALGRLCDKVILMAHDYQWMTAPEENLGTPDTDTPVAPIGRVEGALRRLLDPDTGLEDPGKAALAVSFKAAGVEIDEDGLLLDTKVYGPGPGTLSERLSQPDAVTEWWEGYASPSVTYQNEEGRHFRVWYEDARSVKAKIDLCYEYGVTGLSLWRIGSVPNYGNYDVWSTVVEERKR